MTRKQGGLDEIHWSNTCNSAQLLACFDFELEITGSRYIIRNRSSSAGPK